MAAHSVDPGGKYNPFKPGSVAPPEMFGGRSDVLRAIERLLHQAKKGNPRHFLIDGRRGIGKTSLLHYASSMAAGNIAAPSGATFRFRTLTINLAAGDSGMDCVEKMQLQMDAIADEQSPVLAYVRHAWNLLKQVETPLWKFREEAVPLHELQRRLAVAAYELDKNLGARFDGLGIFVDEADRPDSDADLGALLRSLIEQVARLGSNRVFFAVAGGQGKRGVAAKLSASDTSALRPFHRFTLETLTEEEQAEALRLGFERACANGPEDLVLDDSGAEWIIAFAKGEPSRLQELAYGAVEADRDGRIDTRDVLGALFAVPGQNADDRDLVIGETKNPVARAFGVILSALRNAESGGMTQEEIEEATGLDADLLATTIERLEGYELLVASGTPRRYRSALASESA